ncbi:MAG TPA: DUF4402 domain-containing protein [Gemmatimonadales bacterium]|nr:DUF4402 domain-containing protein [Gemmatimonadales bacterium]
MRYLSGRLLLVSFLAGAPALAAQGRPIRVDGIKPLAFGTIVAGTPVSVSRTDPVRAGQIDLTAQPKHPIIVQLSLPAAMNGPLGATMPLSFGANDGGFAAQGAINAQTAFDPRTTLVITNSQNGRSSVYLGGTTQPSFNQPPGTYTGVITLTVAYP